MRGGEREGEREKGMRAAAAAAENKRMRLQEKKNEDEEANFTHFLLCTSFFTHPPFLPLRAFFPVIPLISHCLGCLAECSCLCCKTQSAAQTGTTTTTQTIVTFHTSSSSSPASSVSFVSSSPPLLPLLSFVLSLPFSLCATLFNPSSLGGQPPLHPRPQAHLSFPSSSSPVSSYLSPGGSYSIFMVDYFV